MTDTIVFEIDFLHLGIGKGDGDGEEKADQPRPFCIRKQTNLTECAVTETRTKKIVKSKKIVIESLDLFGDKGCGVWRNGRGSHD